MNSEELLFAQRRLRGSLLTTREAVMPGASDLAAHLLLYLDDADHCWQLTLDWLRRALDADRVDGGFAVPGAIYRPSGESLRGDVQLATTVGMAFNPADAAVRTVWTSSTPVVFEDVARDARFAERTRAQLLALGMHAKLAMALRDGGAPLALMCCNWASVPRRWNAHLYRQVGELSSQVLSPIFAAAFTVRNEPGSDVPAAPRSHAADGRTLRPGRAWLLDDLTPGELDVARLVVTGMSYKEIAARLNRSFSTVDHRLRSIREKSGARSTARMISMLSDLLSLQQA